MPEMNGIQTLHEMKKMDHLNQATPVYVLTANAVAGAKQKYMEEGFDGFLSKPVVSDKLELAIKKELPQELITEVEDTASEGTHTADIDDLPVIDGLDWNYAILHLSDKDLLMDTVKDFYKLIDLQADKLDNMYSELLTAYNGDMSSDSALSDAFSEYRIQVHGMKSSAATIGIVPLAGMANTLEYAARDEDMEVIHSMHVVFIKAWRKYRTYFSSAEGLGLADEKKEKEYDIEVVKAVLEMLKYNMSNMEVDAADANIAELQKIDFPEAYKGKIDELAALVADLDDEGVAAKVDSLIGELS